MRQRIDSRRLSAQIAAASGKSADLDEGALKTLKDLGHSLDETLEALERESEAGLPADTRFAPLKAILLRVLLVYTRRQDAFNRLSLEALRKIQRRQRLLEEHLTRQQRALLDLKSRLDPH